MAERDVEKNRGARDEGSRVELGPGRKAGSGQTTMAFLGGGLMCEHARRGLKVSKLTISLILSSNNIIICPSEFIVRTKSECSVSRCVRLYNVDIYIEM